MTSTTTVQSQTQIGEGNHIRLLGKPNLDPQKAIANLTVIGSLNTETTIACALTTAHSAKRISGLHQDAGLCGFDAYEHLTAGAKLLETLVSDFNEKLCTAATSMNISLEGGTTSCSGKVDFSGTLGATDENGCALPVKLKHITLSLRLECREEDKGRIPDLIEMTKQESAMLRDIGRSTDVQVKVGHLGRIGPDCVRDGHAKVMFNHMGNGMHRLPAMSAMITV